MDETSMTFVDHLQFLPLPFVGGKRQPDGDHRPGGLGMLTLAEALGKRGWTGRVEDLGFDRPMPEPRFAEAFARAIGDAIMSAWDRRRFPIVLSRSAYSALGTVDALGPRSGIVWVDARPRYRSRGLLRRPALEDTALAMTTGRSGRDRTAVSPQRIGGSQAIVVGGWETGGTEARAMRDDGVRSIGRDLDRLATEVAAVDASRWALHVDCRGLAADAVPAAVEPRDDGLDPEALADAVRAAFEGRPLATVALLGYDLNRDRDGRTLETLVGLIEVAVVAAGGQPRPEAVGEAKED